MKSLNKKINNEIIFSISKYLVEKYDIKQSTKLQKILYFLYLDYLKQYGKKLFEDEFEAWVYGPVVRKIFNHMKDNGCIFSLIEEWNTYELTEIKELDDEGIKNFIDEDIKKYLSLSSIELVEKSHNTLPWKETRGELEYDEPSDKVISFELIKKFVKSEKFNKI